MPITYSFFHDSALTQEATSLNPLAFTQGSGIGAVDAVIYYGSPATGNKARASSSPGVDPIVVSIVDAATGSGASATDFKLALSSGGLAGATAGAPLTLGNTILSGAGNAVPVHVRCASSLTTPARHLDVTFETNDIDEEPV